MTELIYKFLDNYFGDDIIVKRMHLMRNPKYVISSPKGGPIVSFIVHESLEEQGGERISLIGSDDVARMLEGFFSIDKRAAMNQMRNWFGDKHNLKKVSDIKKFIPQNERNNIPISQ